MRLLEIEDVYTQACDGVLAVCFVSWFAVNYY